MNIELLLAQVVTYFQDHPLAVVALFAGFGLLACLKRKQRLKFFAFCLLLGLGVWVIAMVVQTLSTGSAGKDRMIYKSRDVIGD